MNKSILVMMIIAMMFFATFPATAQEIIITSVDPSPYYDSKPCIYGNYVVWRRAINQNNNEYIELREPSWIMVHDIHKGITWNITAVNTLMTDPNIYYHAQSPDIYDGKIIYEAQGSGNSWDTRLYMYNISSKETWEIPLKSTSYAHGHHHIIDGNWIAYTHKENDKRQAYLLNYKDGNYRTIVGKNENYSVYGMVMWKNTIVITALNNTGGYELLTYDIRSTIRKNIHISSNRNYSKIIATTMYEDEIGISIYETVDNKSQWNAYTYDIPNGSLYKFMDGINGFLMWDTKMFYEKDGDIHIYESEKETIIISSFGSQTLGDIYHNEVVWLDNSNGDWDVFLRNEVTYQEIVWDNMILIVIIIAVIGVGLLLSKNSGKEGMI